MVERSYDMPSRHSIDNLLHWIMWMSMIYITKQNARTDKDCSAKQTCKGTNNVTFACVTDVGLGRSSGSDLLFLVDTQYQIFWSLSNAQLTGS
jgi:hypothetical protein